MPPPMEMAAPDSYGDSPFTDAIATVALPKGFSVPAMTLFEGTTNPCDHERREMENQALPFAPPICTKIINVITGGSELSGLTYSAAKRRATEGKEDHLETSCMVNQSNLPMVTFDETDVGNETEQHHDALTITLSIGNCTVRKVLVDTGSSVNLIMFETLKIMGFNKENLIKKSVPLVGFSDPSIISHKLSVNPGCTPVQQKRRKFAAEQNEVINKEVDNLLAAGMIREVSYPDWLSNVVVVPKKNGKLRVYVDFTDLNKACPKDPFPLPHIDAMRPKDVQRLAGKVATLSRFISRASDRCKLFYDILRKSKKFEWTEEHEKTFKELKFYLSTPPLLAKPEQGDPLFLYLSVTKAAVSAVLVREQEGMQHPVYYISKSLLPAETRHTSFEKLVLDLVTASYKLRPYLKTHTIHVVTNYPLKTIMRKPELSGRMTKWSVHLSGDDLQFEPRTRIKSQALADIVSNFCPATRVEAEKGMLTLPGDQESGVWTLYIDGASNARGAGVGLVLRSPKGDMMVQVVRCEFKATNNEAEYEALILEMQMAQGLKVRNLRVYSDSLFVVNNVNNEYVARDSKMIAYLKIDTEQKLKFRSFKITQVPRDQNVEADALATLGATFQPTELSTIPITHVLTPAIQKELEQSQQGEATRVQHMNRIGILASDENKNADSDWRKPYIEWLKDGKLPEDRKEA
ncbi:uncharacterized protein LOC141627733 [Silene latifolia]|uniref:uncharacterized protein LOC141627733 n=1 Tax=Silene latifolia TaxID=37657 RepID=UPI003D77C96B